MITKFDEFFSHTLNVNSLYNFNYSWKVWVMWFHKKHLDKFFIQMSIGVLKKKHFVEKLLSFEWWQDLLEAFVLNLSLYVYQNAR
jgi:hypothetical protein